jgi:hypothetical protein
MLFTKLNYPIPSIKGKQGKEGMHIFKNLIYPELVRNSNKTRHLDKIHFLYEN